MLTDKLPKRFFTAFHFVQNDVIRINCQLTIILSIFLFTLTNVNAQSIPEHISYTRIYDFVDELAMDGIVDINSAIKPYNRNTIASALRQAQQKDSLLFKRQKKDLNFFISEFANELDTMPKAYVHWTNKKTFDLSLLQPQFLYNNRKFKAQLRPIIGMDLYYNSNGLIMKRWYGVDLQMDIISHISIWGSIRDNSFNGNFLNKKIYTDVYKRIHAAKMSQPDYLYNLPGCAYKEANYGGDYSDVRGGIRAYAWFGSIGFMKDNISWGDTYNCSNIISSRAPSFPMITLNLTPCKWFEFNYIHGFLISNVIDSTRWYYEEYYNAEGGKKHYRPMNKYIAANMFTFKPVKGLYIAFGNSIIYSGDFQPIFLIPFAFFKSLDHLMTKAAGGSGVENQNSQVFFNISTRNIPHTHIYGSVFIDEFSISRWRKDNPQQNPVSFKLGATVSNWPLKNVQVGFEYTRSNIICYKHSIQSLTWASNSYNLGHYLGDNSQQFYAFINYKPIRSLNLNLSYTKDQKGNDYNYERRNISQIISQPVLKDIVWENDIVSFKALYEVWPNAYAMLNVDWNYARGHNPTSAAIEGENRMDATGYLNKYTPDFYKGSNISLMVGFSIGF